DAAPSTLPEELRHEVGAVGRREHDPPLTRHQVEAGCVKAHVGREELGPETLEHANCGDTTGGAGAGDHDPATRQDSEGHGAKVSPSRVPTRASPKRRRRSTESLTIK